jgi:peptidoglycan/xylan/chitin deacetylase (PgdA/CDA1 family)
VSGEVLQAGIEPGVILLNRDRASRSTPISAGDAVTVVDGHDRIERTRRTVERLPGRHFGDPESTLRRYRIRRVTVAGQISGHVVSVHDVPRGRGVAHGEVALTFDDGPWPVQSAQIVRILERFHVPATFFLVGYLVERYPGIVRLETRAGMRIGDHSWDHPSDPPLADLSAARVAEEIGRTGEALGALGVRAHLFRPPGDSWNDAVLQEARRQGMRLVTWSVDPKDWTPGIDAGRIVRRVLGAVRAGSIVLLHDGGGDRSATIRALPHLIRGIRRMGLRLVAIPNRA